MIHQTLCLSSLIANNALKRKLAVIFVLRGRKKALKILMVFLFRSTISPEQFLRFWWSFLQATDNLLFFLDKKRKSFKKTAKFVKNKKVLELKNFRFSVENCELKFFSKFWKFSKFFFFYLIRELNCQQFAKKIIKFGGTVLEISYFEKENPSEFFDFWIFKAFFRPLRTQMAPNFCFSALFVISDDKQRV